MALFYKASSKEMLEARMKIFLEKGMLPLKEHGFLKSPFLGPWFGRDELGGYSYELCRLASHSNLELITIDISKGDRWIKIFLNIFILKPVVEKIEQLNRIDGIQFQLPPNSLTNMRLRIDDVSIPPLFNLFGAQHKIGSYLNKGAFDTRIEELGKLIHQDLKNIDYLAVV